MAQGRKGALEVFVGEMGSVGLSNIKVVLVMGTGAEVMMPLVIGAAAATGLKPAAAAALPAAALRMGTLPVGGAKEIMGAVEKATLNRGRDSPPMKLAGGERLSGEALGGVSGA